MELIKIDTIVVADNRQRREFNPRKLDDLTESIRRLGLMHPIVLSDPDSRILVAGERRLRAVSRAPLSFMCNGIAVAPGWIPVTYVNHLSEVERYEAELEENTHRADLTWQEIVDARARLHHLRQTQRETLGEKQTYTDTAREIVGDDSINAVDITNVREATILQPLLHDPEIAAAKSQREAMAIARKKLTQLFTSKLAENFDTTATPTTHTLINDDCRIALLSLPDATFDCILTDPPYGIDAHKMSPMSKSESGVSHEYEDSFDHALSIWTSIFQQGFRITRPEAHLYMFCDFRWWFHLVRLAESHGWIVWPTPIIWYKPNGGMLGDSTRGPRKSYETILFARKGDKRVKQVSFDVIVAGSADTSLHAAAKPVELYTNLLRRSCVPGDNVLDPCAGSGTIFPAATDLRLRATGIEFSATHYGVALQRMNAKPQ